MYIHLCFTIVVIVSIGITPAQCSSGKSIGECGVCVFPSRFPASDDLLRVCRYTTAHRSYFSFGTQLGTGANRFHKPAPAATIEDCQAMLCRRCNLLRQRTTRVDNSHVHNSSGAGPGAGGGGGHHPEHLFLLTRPTH